VLDFRQYDPVPRSPGVPLLCESPPPDFFGAEFVVFFFLAVVVPSWFWAQAGAEGAALKRKSAMHSDEMTARNGMVGLPVSAPFPAPFIVKLAPRPARSK
jgi:hypothetical protein